MATRKAAAHAAYVAGKMAKRRGLAYAVRLTKQGRGWGVALHEGVPQRLPPVVAGVEVIEHERKQRRFRRTFRQLYTETVRRRPRRRRRPTPERLAERLRYSYDPLTRTGTYLGSNKRRRERARFKLARKRHSRSEEVIS